MCLLWDEGGAFIRPSVGILGLRWAAPHVPLVPC